MQTALICWILFLSWAVISVPKLSLSSCKVKVQNHRTNHDDRANFSHNGCKVQNIGGWTFFLIFCHGLWPLAPWLAGPRPQELCCLFQTTSGWTPGSRKTGWVGCLITVDVKVFKCHVQRLYKHVSESVMVFTVLRPSQSFNDKLF